MTSFNILADRTSAWYETGAVRKPLPEIARTAEETLIRQGFTFASHDPNSAHLETEWNTELSPRYHEGVRTMVEVEIVAVETGGYNVRIRSIMEINDSSAHAGDAALASWVGAGVSEKHRDRIPLAALRLQQVLKLRFFGLNP